MWSCATLRFLWNKLSSHEFYKSLTRKTASFERWSWFKLNNLVFAPVIALRFYTSIAKGPKIKVRKSSGPIYMFVGVTREKRVAKGGGGCWLPLSHPSSPTLSRFKRYMLKLLLIRNFHDIIYSNKLIEFVLIIIDTVKQNCAIKARELFGFLPLINNLVTIGIIFLLLRKLVHMDSYHLNKFLLVYSF